MAWPGLVFVFPAFALGPTAHPVGIAKTASLSLEKLLTKSMAILGIGTEIVECVRIAKMIETHGEQFLERVYTAGEIEYCLRTANANQHFARRWAAKEAAMKAMRCRNQGVRWTDIEIVLAAGEGPMVMLSGVASLWADEVGITKLHVSFGACRTHATAYVVATDEMD